jgi:hypothetical protein
MSIETRTTEDFVSLETAKLLKEKGFNEVCRYEYGVPEVDKGYVLQEFYKPIQNCELIETAYTAPTLKMAKNWLREKHHIRAYPILQGNYDDTFKNYSWIVARDGIIYRNPSVSERLSYEEAAEDAIKYCLTNLI